MTELGLSKVDSRRSVLTDVFVRSDLVNLLTTRATLLRRR